MEVFDRVREGGEDDDLAAVTLGRSAIPRGARGLSRDLDELRDESLGLRIAASRDPLGLGTEFAQEHEVSLDIGDQLRPVVVVQLTHALEVLVPERGHDLLDEDALVSLDPRLQGLSTQDLAHRQGSQEVLVTGDEHAERLGECVGLDSSRFRRPERRKPALTTWTASISSLMAYRLGT